MRAANDLVSRQVAKAQRKTAKWDPISLTIHFVAFSSLAYYGRLLLPISGRYRLRQQMDQLATLTIML
jgi:hypothetical protein